MSGSASLSLRQDLISDRFLGIQPVYTGLLLALTRKVPTTNSSVNQLDEPVGLGYARITVPLGSAAWQLINGAEVVNTGTYYFPTATGLWGTIHGWALISTPGAALVKAVGTFNEPYRVVSGIRPFIGPADISFGAYDAA